MFEKALKEAVARLEAAKLKGHLQQYGLIGGLAVSLWSIPRATADIDFIISLGPSSLETLAEFLNGQCRSGSVQDPLLGAIAMDVLDDTGPLQVQLLQFPPAWEKVSLFGLREVQVGEVLINVVHWKALVLLKLYAASPLDLEDAKNILLRNSPTVADIKELKQKSAKLRVSRRLERVLKHLG